MSKTSLQTFGLFLGLAAIVAGAPFLWNTGKGGDGARAGLSVGSKAPSPLVSGGGWIGDAPADDEIEGSVVFVNAWSLQCPICEKGLPDVVDLHAKYKDKVVFVGLSLDGPKRLDDMKHHLAKYKASWPNAYDATESVKNFKTEYIPGYWVIDRKGVVVWNKSSTEDVNVAIDRALKKST
jgi:thiol-disulfide isomerase/thioredoxin